MSDRLTEKNITCLGIIDCGSNHYKSGTRNVAVVFYNKSTNTKLFWVTTDATEEIEDLKEDKKYDISYLLKDEELPNHIKNVKILKKL